ncbi:MAG: 4,5-dihydroxyphthalate decarboxylase [Alphaproteobacteria bacterium]|jgi:4,5-dihydroxyphthalate decarboxylase|nr:4,5-dihydroxyphthalate decarboxylase [Alphaproteobacteria bacterium]
MKLQLSLGIASNPRSWPILDGTVKADGIELIPTILHASELFWRQLHFADFDVSEMSFSSLMMANAAGDERWVGLPIFTTRRFFHTGTLVRKAAGIKSPADLKGKRVGVPEYQQTAALWARGIMQHEFGVSPTEIEFWMERVPSHSHASGVGFKPPPGVTIHQVPIEKSLGSMMLAGELDAVIHYLVHRNLVDRSRADLDHHPDIATLFPDPRAEGARYYKKTGIYPINHGMVIRREIAEKHPWVVLNLLKAFDEANEIANEQRMEHVEYHLASGMISPEAGKALREPVLRHGIKANRHILETAAQYSLEQGLTPRLMKLDEVFAKSTMDQ